MSIRSASVSLAASRREAGGTSERSTISRTSVMTAATRRAVKSLLTVA
jgi:hypothetical protein